MYVGAMLMLDANDYHEDDSVLRNVNNADANSGDAGYVIVQRLDPRVI